MLSGVSLHQGINGSTASGPRAMRPERITGHHARRPLSVTVPLYAYGKWGSVAVSELVFVVVGVVGFLALFRLIGPLEPEETIPDDAPRGYLSDGLRVWPLRGLTMLIGRGPSADIDLDDPRASWVHAELRIVAGSVLLRDLDARHRTRVNGRPVDRAVALVDTDVVTIGRTELTFHSAAQVDAWLSAGDCVHPIRSRLLIGRGSDNDVEVRDRAASWVHAELRREADGIVVHDLWSMHGTRLNGMPVHRRAMLRDGDELRIGSTLLMFHETVAGLPNVAGLAEQP